MSKYENNFENIGKNLEIIAHRSSVAFCYMCYKKAPTGICLGCSSDDLMRFHEDLGCEYGYEWIIDYLINSNLEKVNQDEIYEDMISDVYSEVSIVGFMQLDTVSTMKTMDPIFWEQEKYNYISSLADDEYIISFDGGNEYYFVDDILKFIEESTL